MNIIDRYLDNVQNLPPAPTVAVQLLELFSDPDRDIDRIVKLIKYDPSLTAATLQRCNSGYFQGTNPAEDMFEAVSRLGLYEIYTIVIGLLASRTMREVRSKYTWNATQLWRHSVTTAVAASVLGRRVQVMDSVAFTAGLLHDIGKLIFVSLEGVIYAEMLHNTRRTGPELTAFEEKTIGFSHAALGGRLLARWGLPASICLAVQLHHQSPALAGEHKRLAATVNFANSLAHQLMADSVGASPAVEACPEAMALVELTPKEVPAVVQEVNRALERVSSLLQMQV